MLEKIARAWRRRQCWRRLVPWESKRGMLVLFDGDDGTGKTEAAELLASMLRVELYHVDLAAVVNKYIGETEKNLDSIFKKAKKTVCCCALTRQMPCLGSGPMSVMPTIATPIRYLTTFSSGWRTIPALPSSPLISRPILSRPLFGRHTTGWIFRFPKPLSVIICGKPGCG